MTMFLIKYWILLANLIILLRYFIFQIMAKMYQEQAAAAGAAPEGAGPQPEAAAGDAGAAPDDDNIVDAEVEDVDDSK